MDHETENGLVPGEWRKDGENIFGLRDLTHVAFNNYSKNRAKVCDEYNEYFMIEGAVACQWDILNKITKRYSKQDHYVNIYLKM